MHRPTAILTLLLGLAACGVEDKTTEPDGSSGPATTQATTPDTGSSSGGTTATGSTGATTGAATVWWSTCGDPACGGHTDMGLPTCEAMLQEGAPCDTPGAQCDPINDCNAIFVCAAEDPKPDECPISRASMKREIDYVDREELARLHDELRQIRLATYRYRGDGPAPTKLGMILEDGPDGPWIDEARGRADLYAYTSLAVAALQVQAEQIAALQREVEALRAGVCRPAAP